jgi:RNA polymerase sigma factor (sigma-70 family)
MGSTEVSVEIFPLQLNFCCEPAYIADMPYHRTAEVLLKVPECMPKESWNKQTEKEAEKRKHDLFERTVLPYVNSAYNLARWLARNDQDAEDILQEALLRTLRSFDSFIPGRDGRAWFLTIVRNSCRTWLKRNRFPEATVQLDDSCQSPETAWSDPEAALIKSANSERIRRALEDLPSEYREILVLRELEELSYKEIAQIIEIPLGTVMSRLSRARRELYTRLAGTAGEMR